MWRNSLKPDLRYFGNAPWRWCSRGQKPFWSKSVHLWGQVNTGFNLKGFSRGGLHILCSQADGPPGNITPLLSGSYRHRDIKSFTSSKELRWWRRRRWGGERPSSLTLKQKYKHNHVRSGLRPRPWWTRWQISSQIHQRLSSLLCF